MPLSLRAALALLLIAAPAAAQRVPPLTPSFMVGRWGDNGDCARFVIFRSDGTYRPHAGGEGTWRLRGDRLTITSGGRNTVMQVRAISQVRLTVHNLQDNSRGESQRCPPR